MTDTYQEIQTLEKQLRENPDSPVFARIASLYIDSGEYFHALALTDRGTATYPEYATGFLLRATALYHLNKYEEALQNYKKVLEILPRCMVAADRIEEIGQKLIERQAVTSAKAEEEKPAPVDSDKPSIENIAEKLKGYKPLRPDKNMMQDEEVQMEPEEEEQLPIISETLASIFFKQKQYDKAIEAYRQLIKRTPEKADIYFSRIKQIEEAKEKDT